MNSYQQIPTMTRSERLILERIEFLTRKIDSILEKDLTNSIEVLSLGKACKMLHIGRVKIIDLVKSGKLKSIIYRNTKTRKMQYRFNVSDILAYQNANKYKHVSFIANETKTAKELANDIFKGRVK